MKMLWETMGHEPEKMTRVLEGVELYQHAPRNHQPSPGTLIAVQGRVELRRPYPSLEGQEMVIFVPSPINSAYILDIDNDASLMRYLSQQGFDPVLLHWGKTLPEHAHENIDTYITDYLVPLLQSQNRPIHLVGYCLGGLLAMAASCMTPVKSLTLLAPPWKFDGYSDQRRRDLSALWDVNKPSCDAIGLVPMEIIQSGFWTLSGGSLFNKYARLAGKDPESNSLRRFVSIEDWANGGEPLPFAFAQQLFEDFYSRNIPGKNQWHIAGQIITSEAIHMPVLEFASRTDSIVPIASSPNMKNRMVLDAGHVGMVVGSTARNTLRREMQSWLDKNSN
ncbi:alpha/beta fold hydrolase [Sphingorhabdus sp. Alg239-R122]|uniref:alpha/beta fold hydrolase n=1 Tax=Sphingorhabdus sp. Alg239-R122 TaxID=2305989 RepID=UPI0013DC70B2|nr:alpha/beta fold hydrolase [Sphingorhabdus sp. Alg239-R122]